MPLERILALPRTGARHLIAIGGPPASGKSTLAAELAKQITARGREAKVVPMDGFHLDNKILVKLHMLSRKGSPNTFDTRGLKALLTRLRKLDKIEFPVFDRDRDAVIANGDHIPAQCDIALVEGNYLLCDLENWRDLGAAWSLRVSLHVPADILRARLIQRWLDQGMSLDAATKRAEGNDLPNAQTVQDTMGPADIEISA